MDGYYFEDTLELLGILGGGFVVLVALGTLAGMPWTTTENMQAAGTQVVGALLMIPVGLFTIWLTYQGGLGSSESVDPEPDA